MDSSKRNMDSSLLLLPNNITPNDGSYVVHALGNRVIMKSSYTQMLIISFTHVEKT